MRQPAPRRVRPFVPFLLTFVAAWSSLPGQAAPGGFAETFALATDREAALAQLVPGTEDYYWYHCLWAQHRSAFDEVPALLAAWIDKHGRGDRVREIEYRQALLTFERDSGATYDYLRRQLGLRYDQEQQVPGASRDLPTRLDQTLISPETLQRRALREQPGSVDGLTDQGLLRLVAAGVPDPLLRPVLQKLQRPDVPGLAALVARELQSRGSAGFGALDLHGKLLQSQLDALLQQIPPLLDDPKFVAVYLQRLLPSDDVDWARDAAERERYLDRLWAFAQRLSPVHNALKSHVLYHRIAHDLSQDRLDRDRFLAYLRLPRRTGYANPDWLRRSRGDEIVRAGQQFATGMAPVGDDEALVRTCFERLFATEDAYAPYTDFVREDWLRRVFAETKILRGQGDMERWYSLLGDPGYYEQLAARVELEFPPHQPRHYGTDDAVAIELDVKNVDTLLVKVYEIDAYEYMKAMGKEVDTSIDLDGVVANEERVHRYQEPPLRRVRRSFEFPQLSGPGTWVVEFVGNGTSSRAVIQKGRLTALSRVGAAGHVLTVVDERGAVVEDAVAFCAGTEFAADEHGEIVVPFAPEERTVSLLLRAGAAVSMQRFLHQGESYALELGLMIDRESLRSGRRGRLLLRPRLSVSGAPIALELLIDPVLEITARTRDDVTSVQTVESPEWGDDGEYVHEFEVPRDLAELQIALRAEVQNLSQGKREAVAASGHSLRLNEIEGGVSIDMPLLGRDADGWFLELRGRTGEPIAGRATDLGLHHEDYNGRIDVSLQTDERGRIALGALDGVDMVTVPGLPGRYQSWLLYQPWSLPELVQGTSGSTLRVPYSGSATMVDATVASLIEYRGGAPYRDLAGNLALENGFLAMRDMPAGDFRLHVPAADTEVRVRVTDGAVRGDWAVGEHRALHVEGTGALHIRSVRADDREVRVEVANAGRTARVHVFATRYLPQLHQVVPWLPRASESSPVVDLPASISDYAAGRQLADELRYMLERRYAAKYPGNMLRRPSLLLNPWALDQWSAAVGMGGGSGGRFGGRGPVTGHRASAIGQDARSTSSFGPGAWADFDFLPGGGVVLANLRPDEQGRVVVARADLGQGQHLHVVAVDDDDADYRGLALARQDLQPRDLTLKRALDADTHFAQQQRIEVLAPGDEVRIADVSTAALQTFTTLADAHRLLQALVGDADLGRFSFVLRWPTLDDAEKRRLYKEFACHELHFFLYHKDRAFFDEVLRPYLANKAHKEFLDDWLLGGDLQRYVEPWEFARLNLVERILLLRRLPGRSDALPRYVRELGELLPVDLDAIQRGFLSALRSGELDPDADEVGKLLAPLAEREKGADAPMAAGPAPSPDAARKAETKAPAEPPAAEPSADPSADDKAGAEDFLLGADRRAREEQDLGRRRDQRQLYRGPEPTRTYVEHDYWHRQRTDQDPELIPAHTFWRDYARHLATGGDTPFASPNLAMASGSFTEAMFALAVLDLPFAGQEPVGERDGDSLTLRSQSRMLLARSEILPANAVAGQDPVMIRQECYRLDDRYTFDGDQRRQKTVSGEFLSGVAYGTQVVLTNPTEVPRRLTVLLQVPAGSIPLPGGPTARSVPVELGAFSTATLEHSFYFPAPGDFAQYGAQVAADGAFVGAADSAVRHVVAVPTTVDSASWEHVSQLASADEVLAFLRAQNLQRIDLSRMAWRLKDRGFFDAALALLRQRLRYDDTVWSFALLHGDQAAARQYLANQEQLVLNCGSWLDSPLLQVDAVDRRTYQHMEFEPLFHSRAHRVGPWRAIQNAEVGQQWQHFVDAMCYRPRLSSADWAETTYYLLLQGRIEEALAAFDRVEPDGLGTGLQYDYMAAYLAMFRADTATARRLAAPHRDHPVERWRLLFRDVLQQIDEAEGAGVAAIDPEDRTSTQTQLAATEPALALSVEGGTIQIDHRNLERCELRYHMLDVEFAFSNSPFEQQGLAAVSWVRPSRSDVVQLQRDAQRTSLPVPDEFRRGNVVVEVRGGGLVRRARSLASAMAVQTVESYGQLEVRAAQGGAPLPRVYVKVYARMPGGRVAFHKDGYTDLRGRFDYASVSETGTRGAERFALLVLSENDGAVIREVAPPGP